MTSRDHACLITKLESLGRLSGADKDVINTLPLAVKMIPARSEIVRDGERPTHCCLLLDGWLHRYKSLPNGHRQVLSYHLPGDIPDLQSLYRPVMDHTLATIVESRVAFIKHKSILDIVNQRPGVAAAFWRETLLDAAVFREWIVNVGSRSGPQRVGHLTCELFVRLTSLGFAQMDAFTLLLTQAEIGDATGMSAVHVNRCLQELRADGLIETRGRILHILDWPRLKKFSGFDPTYLLLQDEPDQRSSRTSSAY